MNKNSWIFEVKNKETEDILDVLCFYGVDTQEAWESCIKWSEEKHKVKCSATILGGDVIEIDEKRRTQKKLEKPITTKVYESVVIGKEIKLGDE